MTNDACVNFRHKMSLPEIEQKRYEQINITNRVFFGRKTSILYVILVVEKIRLFWKYDMILYLQLTIETLFSVKRKSMYIYLCKIWSFFLFPIYLENIYFPPCFFIYNFFCEFCGHLLQIFLKHTLCVRGQTQILIDFLVVFFCFWQKTNFGVNIFSEVGHCGN